MNKFLRWKQVIPENARRSVRALARNHSLHLKVAVVALAVATAVALAPRGLSAAASVAATSQAAAATAAPNDDGVTWEPVGNPTQTNDGTGDCEVDMDGTVSGSHPATIAAVQNDLNDEPVAEVNTDGVESLSVYASPANGTADSLKVQAGASISCSLENQTDSYFKMRGHGSLGGVVQAVLDADLRQAPSSGLRTGQPAVPRMLAVPVAFDALPAWLRGAIAAITGGIIFAVVSSITTATLIAFGAAAGPAGVLASPALAAFVGCFAGAVSAKLSSAIAEDNTGILSGIGPLVLGCFAGGAIQFLRSAVRWINPMLEQVSTNPTVILGAGAANNALAAQVDLPIQAAWDIAQQALPEP